MRRIIVAFVVIVCLSSCDSRSKKDQNVVSSDDDDWISLFDVPGMPRKAKENLVGQPAPDFVLKRLV